MKKTFLFLTLLTLNFIYSQKEGSKDYSYKVSAPYKVFDASSKNYFSKGDEAMAVKYDDKEIAIQKFDTRKTTFIKEKIYEKLLPKHAMLEGILEIGSKYYMFFSSWDGDNDNEQLFSFEIDFEKGEFVGSPKLLFKTVGKVAGIGSIGGWMGISMGVTDKFSFLVSHDRKSVLVQYRKKPEVKNDKKSYDIVGLVAYDGNLNEISKREITMPYTERIMNNIDYQLDNNGNLYLLVKVFHDDSNDDKKKKKDVEANYHIELFQLSKGSNEIKISKFENKDKFISKLWMFDSKKDYLVCGGFYSNGKGKTNDSDGIITFKIGTDGKMYDERFFDIPIELINQYESKKTIKKNEKKEEKGEEAKFSNLVLKELAVQDDGSMIIIGEQDFMVQHTTTTSSGTRTYYTYHYNDILISKVAASGTLQWIKKIPKTQMGTRGRGGMSFKYFGANNLHYLIFLDNVKNIDLPIDKVPALHSDGKGGYLTVVRVSDTDGSFKKASIFNGREIEDFQMHQFSVDRIFKTGEDNFMLEIYKKKKEDVMIKVTVK